MLHAASYALHPTCIGALAFRQTILLDRSNVHAIKHRFHGFPRGFHTPKPKRKNAIVLTEYTYSYIWLLHMGALYSSSVFELYAAHKSPGRADRDSLFAPGLSTGTETVGTDAESDASPASGALAGCRVGGTLTPRVGPAPVKYCTAPVRYCIAPSASVLPSDALGCGSACPSAASTAPAAPATPAASAGAVFQSTRASCASSGAPPPPPVGDGPSSSPPLGPPPPSPPSPLAAAQGGATANRPYQRLGWPESCCGRRYHERRQQRHGSTSLGAEQTVPSKSVSFDQ